MSRGVGYIFIEGDQIPNLDKIFETFGYDNAVRTYRSRDFNEADSICFYYPGGSHFGVGVYKGWTIIIDIDKLIVRSYNEDIQDYDYGQWKDLSSILHTKILVLWTYDTISRHAFYLFENGKQVRALYDTDGNIEKDEGVRLHVESLFTESRWVLIEKRWIEQQWLMMKEVTGFDEYELETVNPREFIIKIYDPYHELDEVYIAGVVYDKETDKYVRKPNVKLIIDETIMAPCDGRSNMGNFSFYIPKGMELSRIRGQNKILAEKDEKSGSIIITENNWMDLHRIYIK